MNAPDLTKDDRLGLYLRSTDTGAEWWRVSVADRPNTFRLEHGVEGLNGEAAVDIDLVVDSENLRAKLKKWHREGFAVQTFDAAPAGDTQQRTAFMPELQRAARASARLREARDGSHGTAAQTVSIGQLSVPCGAGGPLVPRVNPAYLFSGRFDDIVADIVENRRVMLIGHTGAGKTSLIEQVAARSGHGVVRSNMNGQTTVGDFVGF
jgi:cobaltochelatase CobS